MWNKQNMTITQEQYHNMHLLSRFIAQEGVFPLISFGSGYYKSTAWGKHFTLKLRGQFVQSNIELAFADDMPNTE